MKTDDVIVKKSEIEGKGVFALRHFKKGGVVLRWDTLNNLSKDKMKELSKEELRYVTFWDNKYLKMESPEKYVNHSCKPNTTAKDFCDIAIKDIKKGEEITGNYEESSPSKIEMKCNCGSKKCKKIIKV